MTKKVILTGFKPFGPYFFNPTEDAVKYFNSIESIPGIEIKGIVLPCTYESAFLLNKIIDEEKPDAIISMGLSSSVKGIRIETVFMNLMGGKYPDSSGNSPKMIPICNNGRNFLSPQSNYLFLADKLYREKIPIEISANADTYICNSLGYLLTKKIIEENLPINNMFINIPWTDDYKDIIKLDFGKVTLEKEIFYKAIELLIKNI